MRTLLPHSLRRLAIAIVSICLLSSLALAQIPQPIGHLSDYGAVLDRHGRERIEGLIEEAWEHLDVEVFILASWENPYATTAAFADAVFNAWALDQRGETLLLVLVKFDRDWTHAVIGSGGTVTQSSMVRLHDGIADLVAHRRIEEAMSAFFALLADLSDQAAPIGNSSLEERSPLTWLIPTILAVAVALIVGIRRFVCPRCGRILRRTSSRSGVTGGDGHRVYSCHSCGYRRE